MIKKFRNMKIKTKLMMVFFVVVFLPVIFVGVFLTVRMKDMALEQSFEEANNEVVRIANNIEEMIEFNATLQNSIVSDTKLQKIVETKYKDTLQIFDSYNGYKVLEEYERTHSSIEDIRIYVENDTLLDNLDFMVATEEVRESWWYKQALLWKGKVFASYYYDGIKKKDYLMLAKQYETRKKVNMVIMTLIDLDFIYSFIETERLNIVILDAKSDILASTNPQERGQNLYDAAGIYIVSKEQTWQESYQGMKSQLFLKSIDKNYFVLPLYVLSSIPLDTILGPANDASRLGLIVIFLSIMAAAIFIIWFSDLMTKKISQMVVDIKRVAEGDFDSVHVYQEEDEIGVLSKNLYSMSQSLSKLIESEKELLVSTEQMKFEVLSSQVNPHFLFNILESLRMKAHLNGDREISHGIKLLGQLMRRSLEMTHDLVSVEEEIEFVRRYMDLQKFRFGERISYDIHMEEEAKDIRILPLLIQPIVENAIVHGLEAIKEDGKIHIRVTREQGLTILIIDNGKGIEQEKLKNLRKPMSCDKNIDVEADDHVLSFEKRRHIGISNVRDRMMNYYGSEAKFLIESSCDMDKRGTKVMLKIPIKKGANS